MALLFVTDVLGQTRTLTGKVINDEFEPLPQVWISNADTVLLAKTGMGGDFSITVPSSTKTLIIATVGMEWKILDLLSDCNNLDVILQPRSTYDFMSPAKVDRLRKKQFDKLPALHQSAFAKGVFNTNKPCYVEKFSAEKKGKIERHKAWKRRHST